MLHGSSSTAESTKNRSSKEERGETEGLPGGETNFSPFSSSSRIAEIEETGNISGSETKDSFPISPFSIIGEVEDSEV
jgi:hypothetical protein